MRAASATWPHDFLGVAGHPDDDECTYRADGTDATYCGEPRAAHDHHPKCYQSTGAIPDDLPDDLCDCRALRMLDALEVAADAYQRGMVKGARQALLDAADAPWEPSHAAGHQWLRDRAEAVARIEGGAR